MLTYLLLTFFTPPMIKAISGSFIKVNFAPFLLVLWAATVGWSRPALHQEARTADRGNMTVGDLDTRCLPAGHPWLSEWFGEGVFMTGP